MDNKLWKLLAPPVFPQDEDKTRSAAILNSVGWSTIGTLVVLLVIRNIDGRDVNLAEANVILSISTVLIGLALLISRQGYVRAASLLFVTIAWGGLSYLTWVADGIHDVAFFGYFIPILMAGLLLSWQGAIGFVILSALSGWVLAYAQEARLFSPTLDQPLSFARDMTGIFVLTGILIYLVISNLQNALKKSRSITQQLTLSNRELSELRVNLERRVEERTAELEKRARQLEAVSSVARAIASVQDLDALLPEIAMLVSQQFGFYHVGIFLIDETERSAVLRASNSEGGRRMLARNHRLPVDSRSIVGYAALRGEPRIVSDVRTDPAYVENPDLAATRSELALPLRIAGTVTGILDVQSMETNAFSPEDIAVLATLTDQIAIAIENARLFGEARQALAESRALLEKYTRQDWSSFARQVRNTGFLFNGKQVVPLDAQARRDHIKAVIQTGSLAAEKASASVAVPIRLRGQTIGVLHVRSKRGARPWSQDEIALLEAAAERAALALENARLVENAQRRASRERAIGEISARIGTVSNVDSILQTAVEELGRRIGGAAEVVLELDVEEGSA